MGALQGCDAAPSRSLLGAYFPSWMLCALLGIAAGVIARAILKATGVLDEVPRPFVAILAIICATTFGIWLVWLA